MPPPENESPRHDDMPAILKKVGHREASGPVSLLPDFPKDASVTGVPEKLCWLKAAKLVQTWYAAKGYPGNASADEAEKVMVAAGSENGEPNCAGKASMALEALGYEVADMDRRHLYELVDWPKKQLWPDGEVLQGCLSRGWPVLASYGAVSGQHANHTVVIVGCDLARKEVTVVDPPRTRKESIGKDPRKRTGDGEQLHWFEFFAAVPACRKSVPVPAHTRCVLSL